MPHAFGEHKNSEENRLSYYKWLQNPDTFSHKDLPNGKGLKGKKKKLTSLFSTYSSDIVINDLVENASSQGNESLVPKFLK